MYDNVDFYLPIENIGNMNLLVTMPNYLTDITHTRFSNEKRQLTGYIKGLKVQVNENSLNFKGNSICKWFLGNNVETMTRLNFKESVEELSDLLHVPIKKAKVNRIDVSTNIKTDQKPSQYYPYLGSLKYFDRSTYSKDSLYYNQPNGQLLFYDKIKDCKSKKVLIPEMFSNNNLLRYERRFKKNICKKFNTSLINMGMLYDKKFYREVIMQWYNDYQNILKIKEKNKLDYGMIKTISELYTQALILLIDSRGGLISAINDVKLAQNKGILSRKQAQDFRNKYNKVSSNKLFFDENDLIIELNSKITEVYNNYL